jgi:hypothetical protein
MSSVSRTAAGVPRFVWQTWKTRATDIESDETLREHAVDLRAAARTWKGVTRTGWDVDPVQDKDAGDVWTRFVMDDVDIAEWMEAMAPPKVARAFAALSKPVEKADLWRYTVVAVCGGVYADMDIHMRHSPETWTKLHERRDQHSHQDKKDLLLTGWFAASSPFWDHVRVVEMVQWTFAATPRHPVMMHVIDVIADVILAGQVQETLHKTGPRVWTQVIMYSMLRDATPQLEGLQFSETPVYHGVTRAWMRLLRPGAFSDKKPLMVQQKKRMHAALKYIQKAEKKCSACDEMHASKRDAVVELSDDDKTSPDVSQWWDAGTDAKAMERVIQSVDDEGNLDLNGVVIMPTYRLGVHGNDPTSSGTYVWHAGAGTWKENYRPLGTLEIVLWCVLALILIIAVVLIAVLVSRHKRKKKRLVTAGRSEERDLNTRFDHSLSM